MIWFLISDHKEYSITNGLHEGIDVKSSVWDRSPHGSQDDDPDLDSVVYNDHTGEYEEHILFPKEEDNPVAHGNEGIFSYGPFIILNTRLTTLRWGLDFVPPMPGVHQFLWFGWIPLNAEEIY